ncbi:aspartic peptidase domain-containing protein, partial [Zopfochytrium polystomum]
FNAQIDSGSSDLVIPGSTLNNYSLSQPTYDIKGKTPVISGITQSFYDGTWWTGNFYQDVVSLDGPRASAIFAVMTKQSSTPVTNGEDSQGLMGIAFDSLAVSPLTVVTAMVQSGSFKSDAIGFRGCPATSDSPSVIDWGNEEKNLTCTQNGAPLGWAAVGSKSYYNLNVKSVAVAGKDITLPTDWQTSDTSIIDSCTTLLLLPSAVFDVFVAKIKATGELQAAGLSSTDVDDFLYSQAGLPMDVNYSKLPEISFSLDGLNGEIITLILTGRGYIQGDGTGYFYFPVASQDTSNVVFGSIIYDSFYVVMDRGNGRVGFGPGCDCEK